MSLLGEMRKDFEMIEANLGLTNKDVTVGYNIDESKLTSGMNKLLFILPREPFTTMPKLLPTKVKRGENAPLIIKAPNVMVLVRDNDIHVFDCDIYIDNMIDIPIILDAVLLIPLIRYVKKSNVGSISGYQYITKDNEQGPTIFSINNERYCVAPYLKLDLITEIKGRLSEVKSIIESL